jgi:PAS domain S-box-containing protein
MTHRWFLDDEAVAGLVEVSYRLELSLVLRSLVIAILGAYTAFHLVDRVTSARSTPAYLAWLSGGAVAMGCAIWGMHFIGMLAVRLDVPVAYDLDLTLLSWAIAVLGSALAFLLLRLDKVTFGHLVLGGAVMGLTVSAMHYTGMAAMRLPALMLYDAKLYAASVVVAVCLSAVALSLLLAARRFMKTGRHGLQITAAVVMGLSITTMHYTAMAATHFFSEPARAVFTPNAIDLEHLNAIVSVSIFLLLGLALAAKQVSKRMDRHIAAREQSDALLGAMLRHLPSPAFVMDPAGVYLSTNPAFDASYRAPGPEPRIADGVVSEAERRALAAGEIIEREEVAPAEDRVFLSTRFPMRDGAGRIVAFGGVSWDITRRKRAEEALRRREEQLEAAQRIARIGHWSLDLKAGRFEGSEEIHRIYGIEPGTELSFKGIVDAIHDEDRAGADRNRDRAIAERRGYDFAFRIRRPDGEIRFVEGRTVPVFGEDGAISGFVGVTQDVTERERA